MSQVLKLHSLSTRGYLVTSVVAPHGLELHKHNGHLIRAESGKVNKKLSKFMKICLGFVCMNFFKIHWLLDVGFLNN